MDLSKLLIERVTDIVYHATSLYKAARIAETDTFQLSPAFASDTEQRHTGGRMFYLSTTRSKHGSYSRDTTPNYQGSVMLKLDGRKLSERYKGGAVDYWGPRWRRDDPSKHEMEDRIMSDEPVIPNASDYILEIHVLLLPELTKPNRANLLQLKKLGKPVYLYQASNQREAQAYILMDKRRAVPLTQFTMKPATPDELKPSYLGTMDRAASKRSISRHQVRTSGKPQPARDLSRWIKLLRTPADQFHTLHYSLQDVIRHMGYDHLRGDALRDLEADISNLKSNPELKSSLTSAMKDAGVRSPKEILEYLYNKFKGAK